MNLVLHGKAPPKGLGFLAAAASRLGGGCILRGGRWHDPEPVLARRRCCAGLAPAKKARAKLDSLVSLL